MKQLITRIQSSIVYAIIVIGGMTVHPFLFGVVFLSILIFSMLEFYRLASKAGTSPQTIAGTITGSLSFCLLLGIAGKWLPLNFIWIIPALGLALFVSELYRNKNQPMVNIAITLLGIIYIAFPFGLAGFLIFPGIVEKPGFYPWILFGVVITIWVFDSGAYLAGTLLGKHRLFERISPKKSWEGVIGGGIAAVITGILNALWISGPELTDWLMISLLIIMASTYGDLIESMFKRSLNMKDSGNVLPGHGGFLDRFDSILFVIPVVFIYLIIFVKLFQN